MTLSSCRRAHAVTAGLLGTVLLVVLGLVVFPQLWVGLFAVLLAVLIYGATYTVVAAHVDRAPAPWDRSKGGGDADP